MRGSQKRRYTLEPATYSLISDLLLERRQLDLALPVGRGRETTE
jgi:hypothetical protein